MVKSITSAGNLVKTVAMSALLAGSVALGATNPVKTTRQGSIPNQTEVVSKDGAEAVKAMTLPQQQKPAVPTVRNKKIDDKFLKLCSTPEEKKAMDDELASLYKDCGSYLGSVTVQQNLDLNMFLRFLNGDIEILKNFEGEYRETEHSSYEGSYYDVAKKYYTPEVKAQLEDLNSKVGEWVSNNFFTVYSGVFNTDHPPDCDETSKMFEKFFNSIDNYEFSPGNKMFDGTKLNYVNDGIREKVDNSKSNEIQKNMDIFAAKINYADNKMFWNLSKLFYYPPSNKKLFALYKVFMQAVRPNIEQ